MQEAPIPGVRRVELVSRGDVKDEVPQRRLQSVEGKIERVEAEDSYQDSSISHHSLSLWVPIALSTPEEINQSFSYW